MHMRRAQVDDLDVIVQWRREAAAWLATLGTDQWSEEGLDDTAFRERVRQSISDDETWMAVTDDDTPVGTIALDQWADEGLWSEEALRRSLVLHRMILDRDAAGLGVGERMLQHADQLAADTGLEWLVLDAWSTNAALHDYYRRQGFEHVRTAPGVPSGALFQRRVQTDPTSPRDAAEGSSTRAGRDRPAPSGPTRRR